ncbi:hypothetical protein R84B8_02109 [Treponema sp. R8-4-B8]
MKFLVVSDREYKKTNRGIDMITFYLAENKHSVDHLVFFTRKKYSPKQVSVNIRQLYTYDPIRLYYKIIQFIFPSFILLAYFRFLIRKQTPVDFSQYDYVVLESGLPIYFSLEISNKIIYRQSDPIFICFNSNRRFYKLLEENVIKKSVFVTSALKEQYFPVKYKDKITYFHSGFIPYQESNPIYPKKQFVIIGGGIDLKLLKKMAINHPDYIFYVIGIQRIRIHQKNIIFKGYLDFNEYQKIILSSFVVIIPYSKHFTYLLRQTSFSAKILLPMQLGIPILIKAYGDIQNKDYDKKLYVYKSHKEALTTLKILASLFRYNGFDRKASNETMKFLIPQMYENRLKKLDEIFNRYLKIEVD